jgi:hypothetical protein
MQIVSCHARTSHLVIARLEKLAAERQPQAASASDQKMKNL